MLHLLEPLHPIEAPPPPKKSLQRPRDMPRPTSLLQSKVVKSFFAETENGELTPFRGEVVHFNRPDENAEGQWLFEIQYEDGDSETIPWSELKTILVKVPSRRWHRPSIAQTPPLKADSNPPTSPPHVVFHSHQRLLPALLAQTTHNPPLHTSMAPLRPINRLQGAVVRCASGKTEPVFTTTPSADPLHNLWHSPPSCRGSPQSLDLAHLLFQLVALPPSQGHQPRVGLSAYRPGVPSHHAGRKTRLSAEGVRNNRHRRKTHANEEGVVESKHNQEDPPVRTRPAHHRITTNQARPTPLFTLSGSLAKGPNLLHLNANVVPNYIREDTPADGNCFYHVVSMSLYGHWDHNHYVRKKVADEIEQNTARYRLFQPLNATQFRKINLPNDHISTFADLVKYSRTPGCWAFGTHHTALQRCFAEVKFFIWQPLPKPPPVGTPSPDLTRHVGCNSHQH